MTYPPLLPYFPSSSSSSSLGVINSYIPAEVAPARAPAGPPLMKPVTAPPADYIPTLTASLVIS